MTSASSLFVRTEKTVVNERSSVYATSSVIIVPVGVLMMFLCTVGGTNSEYHQEQEGGEY